MSRDPDDIIVVRAGESAVVPEGPQMMLSSVGSETWPLVLVALDLLLQAVGREHDLDAERAVSEVVAHEQANRSR